jgi:hypothetical protein
MAMQLTLRGPVTPRVGSSIQAGTSEGTSVLLMSMPRRALESKGGTWMIPLVCYRIDALTLPSSL